MARSSFTDLLQVYPFWLLDAYPVEPLSLPVLTPLFGFSAITAPEVTADIMEINEANWYYKRKIIKGADASNIVVQRGVTFYDSDFWRWMLMAITGDTKGTVGAPGGIGLLAPTPLFGLTPRRTLLLVQFITRPPVVDGLANGIAGTALQGALAAAGAALAGGGAGNIIGAGVNTAVIGSVSAAGLGPFEFAARIPAKAWLLHNVLPARYKAGTDFDAMSSAVSIQELELVVEMMEEVSLTA